MGAETDAGKLAQRDLPPLAIELPPQRHRKLRRELVATLAASMKDRGLLNPITVMRLPGPHHYQLVAGLHRLEAAKDLHWDWIAARILPRQSGIYAAELAEIDENLIRANLSPAERAAHQARRKEIYETLHGSPKAKGAAAANRSMGRQHATAKLADASYARETAQIGVSERSVQREAQRGAAIADVASLAGTSLDKGEELDALAKLGESARDALVKRAVAGERVSAKTELKRQRRGDKERDLAAATQLASARLGREVYSVLYADPPWRFEVYGEAGMDRAADNHYPTMTIEQLRALAMPAAADAVLFLWTTVPMQAHSHALIEAWGFTYKSQLVWLKDKHGTGYWARNRHEILLIATRGEIPAPAMGTQPSSVIEAPVGRHSEKPAIFAELIAQMFPTLPKIELFARAPRDGWSVWGNEARE